MSRNRSLDEFVTEGEDAESDPKGADCEAGPDGGTGEAGAVDPIVSTYDRSAAGALCASCGAVVEERWRDGDDLVCTDCKEW